mgnify:CR=1 FL=1
MQAEIVIVGAGPAGCATALSLCQLDPALAGRTLVLERARHPRPKLCAGGCVADVDNCLRRLGLDLSNQPHVPVSTMQFLYGDRGFAFQPDPVSLRVVRRAQYRLWAMARGVRSLTGATYGVSTRVHPACGTGSPVPRRSVTVSVRASVFIPMLISNPSPSICLISRPCGS